MNEQLWNVWHKGKSKLMNDEQTITWHYVMDIHDPEEIWYSLIDNIKCNIMEIL